MKQKIKYIYGGIIGLLIGAASHLLVTWPLFFRNLDNARAWRSLLLSIIPTGLIGVLLVLSFIKFRKVIKNKVLFWLIYAVIIALILGFLILWFLGLRIATVVGGM